MKEIGIGMRLGGTVQFCFSGFFVQKFAVALQFCHLSIKLGILLLLNPISALDSRFSLKFFKFY